MTSESSQRCGRCKQVLASDLFSPSYRGKNGTWCRACFAAHKRGEYVSTQYPELACDWCGSKYRPVQMRDRMRYCSRQCKDKAQRAAASAAIVAAKPDRRCLYCDSAMPRTMRRDARFCSEQCNSNAHSITRAMARRAGTSRPDDLIGRAYIANRDKWTCGICGKPVSRTRRHPDPLAGSIDHIVPLAMGGANDLTNLQLAHLQCNWGKRQHGGGQLRLLG